MEILSNFAYSFFAAHPQIAAWILVFTLANTVVKSVVDALVSSRAQWDKTPQTDDNWFEKGLSVAGKFVEVVTKALAYLAGFRPKPKAEIIIEKKEEQEKE